jgi:hypothetical protein
MPVRCRLVIENQRVVAGITDAASMWKIKHLSSVNGQLPIMENQRLATVVTVKMRA